MKYETILFDMDGVLIDSEELMAKSGVLALKEFGIDAVPEDFRELWAGFAPLAGDLR